MPTISNFTIIDAPEGVTVDNAGTLRIENSSKLKQGEVIKVMETSCDDTERVYEIPVTKL